MNGSVMLGLFKKLEFHNGITICAFQSKLICKISTVVLNVYKTEFYRVHSSIDFIILFLFFFNFSFISIHKRE